MMRLLSDVRARLHCRLADWFLRLHRYEAAANAYERALGIQPDDRQAHLDRAWCLLNVPKRRAEGIEAVQVLLRVSPTADGFFALGCGLQQESRHEEAVESFREAGRLEDQESADFYYNYGVSLVALQRWEEGADAFQNAVHLDPSAGDAWGNLGAIFALLSRWEDAAPCQERAMRLAPSVRHGLDLASTLYELNRLDDAERVLREVLTLDPRSVEAKEVLATVLSGQDRCDETIELASELCESTPDAVSSRVVLVGALAEAGRVDEALTTALATAEDAPQDARVHSALGGLFVKMKDGASALAAFERMALCLGPENERQSTSPWVSYIAGRGTALALLGQHDQAAEAFDEVLRIDPTFFERWPEVAAHHELSLREIRRNATNGR